MGGDRASPYVLTNELAVSYQIILKQSYKEGVFKLS